MGEVAGFQWIPILFFFVALLYSSVGFAGGSSYLALLALFSVPYELIPKIALLCNILVAAGGFYQFFSAGHFSFKKNLPYVLTSVPCAYLGGSIPVSKEFFFITLGGSLIAAGISLLLGSREFKPNEDSSKRNFVLALSYGAGLGLLSGLMGIGGGIFLSPLMMLSRQADAKKAAAAASFFILVNSFSGLLGQLSKSNLSMDILEQSKWLFVAVLVASQIGSRLGSRFVSRIILQRITGFLIIIVGTGLLIR